jgi:hypothetical protein
VLKQARPLHRTPDISWDCSNPFQVQSLRHAPQVMEINHVLQQRTSVGYFLSFDTPSKPLYYRVWWHLRQPCRSLVSVPPLHPMNASV